MLCIIISNNQIDKFENFQTIFSLVKLHIAFKCSSLSLLFAHCGDERQMYWQLQAKRREYTAFEINTLLVWY